MRTLRNALLGAAVGLAVMAGTTPAHADTASALSTLQTQANQAVAGGYPGVVGLVEDTTTGTGGYVRSGHNVAGSSDQIDPTGQYRIGSCTKLYISTVILQLEAEGKLSVDDTVAKWVPNALNTNGYDGTTVTIRQLLNHTSGIPDYTDKVVAQIPFGPGVTLGWEYFNTDLRGNTYAPQDLVNAAESMPHLTPGVWSYSNTDYILAGMIIKAVTGNDPSVEVTNRIIKPLNLTGTSYPTSDPNLYGNFTHGYHYTYLFNQLQDSSAANVEIMGAAGAMISTIQDQATFVLSLLQGKLLPPAQMTELETTVDAPNPDEAAVQQRYGLGIAHIVLPGCNKGAWVHGGRALGYQSHWYASEDGTRIVVDMGNEENGSDIVGTPNLVNGGRSSLCQLLT